MFCYFKNIEFLYFRKGIFESQAKYTISRMQTSCSLEESLRNFGHDNSFKAVKYTTEKRGLRIT